MYSLSRVLPRSSPVRPALPAGRRPHSLRSLRALDGRPSPRVTRLKEESLYYQLLRIRRVEEAIALEYKNQEMRCPVHLCIGHEAIAVGVCANLTREDVVFSNHRSHGHYLAKGGDLAALAAELYGKETGCSKGRGGSQHLIDTSVNFLGSTPIVGGTIPIAVGSAFASSLLPDDRITVVFFGDGAMEEGVAFESLNFAALRHLPVLFVCENNFYSICTNIRDRQPKRDIYTIAKSQNIASYQVDGNDVLAVADIAQSVTSTMRKKKQPAFLECITYRFLEHCGPNAEPEGHRPPEEVAEWRKKDPLLRLQRSMVKKNLTTAMREEKEERLIAKEISHAFAFARKSPYPKEIPDEKQVFARERVT